MTCLCLNVDIDPEEWRDDLAREVPVARREGDVNAWTGENYGEQDSYNRDAIYDQIQKTLKKNYIGEIYKKKSCALKMINKCVQKQ